MAKSAAIASQQELSLGGRAKAQWTKATEFLGDVRNEMRKVSSPSRKEVQSTTLVVVVTVFLFAGYFFVVDKVLGLGIDRLIHTMTSR